MHTYGEKIREERERLGLSQTEFGDKTGVTKKTQGLYERGEREPKVGAQSPFDEARFIAVRAIQEWQIEAGRTLPIDKFLRAIDLIVELSGDHPQQVRKHADNVLRLVA